MTNKPTPQVKEKPKAPGHQALLRAVEVCGSRSELARRIGCEVGVVWNWLNKTSDVPLYYVPFIVAAVNHPDVTLFTLRPDYQAGWLLLARLLEVPDAPAKPIRKTRNSGDAEPADADVTAEATA